MALQSTLIVSLYAFQEVEQREQAILAACVWNGLSLSKVGLSKGRTRSFLIMQLRLVGLPLLVSRRCVNLQVSLVLIQCFSI